MDDGLGKIMPISESLTYLASNHATKEHKEDWLQSLILRVQSLMHFLIYVISSLINQTMGLVLIKWSNYLEMNNKELIAYLHALLPFLFLKTK